MRNGFLLVLISIISMSFSNNITDGPWIISKKGKVILYTRPVNYSKKPSPDSANIRSILEEQNDCLENINHKLGVNFKSKFSVYLFNYDEAKDKIGTNGGGYAISRKKVIFYTYNASIKKSNKGTREYLGEHELVHLVTTKEFGHSNFRVLREGYAVAISGDFGRERSANGENVSRSIEKWMKEYVSNGKVLKPSELINGGEFSESIFYPQAGFFIDWLFDTYSVKKINRLYKSNGADFKRDFEKITSERFDSMEIKYLKYCDSIK